MNVKINYVLCDVLWGVRLAKMTSKVWLSVRFLHCVMFNVYALYNL